MTRPCSISPIRSAGHEDLAAGDAGEGAADGRILVVAEPDEQVVDPAEAAAVGVAEVAADDQREVQDGGGAVLMAAA